MNNNFYFFGKLFLGLTVACGLLQSILHLYVGPQIVGLESFMGWFIVTSIISVAGSLFVLKYFQYNKFRLAFSSGIVGLVSQIFLAVLILMALTTRQLPAYYISAIVVSLAVGFVYGASLIFTDAGKSPRLKAAGIIICAIGVVFGAALLMGIGQPLQSNNTLAKVDQWTSLVRNLIPLLYMLEFSKASGRLKMQGEVAPATKTSENVMAFGGIVAFILTLAFGVMFAKDGIGSVVWGARNAAKTQALVERSDVRSFVNDNGDSLRYLLMKPLDFDPQKKYPMVVCLPYGDYESPPAQWLAEDVNRKKYPAFLFVPYRVKDTSWGGVPERFRWPSRDSLLHDALEALTDPGIDGKRIYVSGVSLGGYGSWHMIGKYPEMFAAAIPVCGEGDPELAERIVDIPVWAFHGAKDKNVPVSGSRNMIDAMKKAGGNPQYTEFGHKAHNIWHEVTQTPGVLDWLFAQKRE